MGDFQDEQNEDGANEVAKKGPVPPAKHPKPPGPMVPDFQGDQSESGAKYTDMEMDKPGEPPKPA